jgi:GTPase SAR1 family protein
MMRNPLVEVERNLLGSKQIISEYLPEEQVDSTIVELTQKIEDQVLQVMLYGAYNAGKSTLVNALLGQEKAQVNDIPTTDAIDCYDWNGYRLLDTPGVNAPIEHEKTTMEQIKRTQVMLFVIRDGDFDSKDLYERLFEMIKLKKKVFIVLNHQLTSEYDKAIAYQKVIEILCHKSSTYGVSDEDVKQVNVLLINVKTALTGRLKGDHPKLLEHSGYDEFIDVFCDWLKTNDSQGNHLDGLKNTINELWYKPTLDMLFKTDASSQNDKLRFCREDKKMLVERNRALSVESRNLISHELTLVKSDISSCIQSCTDQPQIDTQLQSIIDPIGDKLEAWLVSSLGEVNSSLNVSVTHKIQENFGPGNSKLLETAIKGLGHIATPDNIKGALLKGRSFKIPVLKGRWEKTLGKWAGKAAIAIQLATAAWDFYKAGREQDDQNELERQAAVGLYQVVEEVCSAVKRDYSNVAEQVITNILNAKIHVLDTIIEEQICEADRYQQNRQKILNFQSQLELISY